MEIINIHMKQQNMPKSKTQILHFLMCEIVHTNMHAQTYKSRNGTIWKGEKVMGWPWTQYMVYIYGCPNKACSLVQWKSVSKHLIWEDDSEVEVFRTQAWGWEFESSDPEEMLVGICGLLVIPEGRDRAHHTHGHWVALRNSASMKKAQEWLRLIVNIVHGPGHVHTHTCVPLPHT